MGRIDVSGAGPSRPSAPPPAIIAAAPPTGSSAIQPGNGDVPLSLNAAMITAARPAQPSQP